VLGSRWKYLEPNLFMILVFTGNGKGKTTVALGQAMRALGNNERVLIIQFIKGPFKSGEDILISKFKNQKLKLQIKNKNLLKGLESFYDFKIIKTGKGFVGILGDKLPFSVHKKAAEKGLKIAEKAIKSKKYDLIILDEINNAVDLKFLKEKQVLSVIKIAQKEKDIILTGRNAPESFIKMADLATEMKEVKHPYQKGEGARKGIEF